MNFSREELGWVSTTVASLYAARTAAEVATAAIAATHERFRLVASTCEEFGDNGFTYSMHGIRIETAVPKDYAAYVHDNPITIEFNKPLGAVTAQLSRLSSDSDWKNTDHFNGIAKPVGFRDQLAISGGGSSSFGAIGLYRDVVFNSREVAVVYALQPHLQAVWSRVSKTLRRSESQARPKIELTRQLNPVGLDATQQTLLRAYFPSWRATNTLPVTIAEWARACAGELMPPGPLRPLRAFRVESPRGRLLLRFYPAHGCQSAYLMLIETPEIPSFLALRRAGLTHRECEVLHWIAQGKRDAEIATILACAPATVSKHVEHVLAKFRVANRAAAVHAARMLLTRDTH